MGVYLPNMEMPKEGEWISVNISPDGKCFVQSWCGKDFNFAEKLTAVPIPSHGDLIDRDALGKDIDKYIGGEESRSRFHHWVQVQRTVIPKSEEART